MEASQPEFGMQARILKGRFGGLAGFGIKRGSVTITGDRLSLLSRNGAPIGDYPLDEVRAKARKGADFGASVRIWTNDRTYVLQWGKELDTAQAAGGAALGELGRGLGQLAMAPRNRKVTQAFLDALRAGGGQVV